MFANLAIALVEIPPPACGNALYYRSDDLVHRYGGCITRLTEYITL